MEKQVKKTTVQKLLIDLGITPKTSGYGYLTLAIMHKLDCRPGDISMCRLYEFVGKAYNTTAASAERCMRFAVSRAYNMTKFYGLNKLYNASIITRLPMLSEFIMYIVEYLDVFYEMNGCEL